MPGVQFAGDLATLLLSDDDPLLSTPPSAGDVTVAGSQAAETDTANGGTPRVLVAGSQAAETDTAFAGTYQVDISVNGSQASETDTAFSGTPRIVVAGSQAQETDTANVGSYEAVAVNATSTPPP